MDSRRLEEHRQQNQQQTFLLAGTLALLLALIGHLVGGWPLALGGLVAVFFAHRFGQSLSEQILLRSHRARPLARHEAPQLYAAVEVLAHRAGLPVPSLWIYPHPAPNAFATGSERRPVIALSQGLLTRLEWDAVVGVLGHEISHIRNGDLPLMGFADLVTRFTAIFSFVGLLMLVVSLPLALIMGLDIPWLLILLLMFAPQIAIGLQLALSRTREFEADRGSAELIGSPQPLIKALRRIDPPQLRWLDRLVFRRQLPEEPSALRSHPPTEERIARLAELELKPRWSPLQVLGSQRLAPDLSGLVFEPPGWRWWWR